MKKLFMFLLVIIVPLAAGCVSGGDTPPQAEGKEESQEKEAKGNFILATTTSTQDSGLLDVLVPMFEEQTGYMVKTIAVGTGKALEMGDNGEADVLLVHAPDAEKKLIENGSAINRQLVMHNDFVLVGPDSDPAGIKGMNSAEDALAKINETASLFISRGDDSGTHKKELKLWEKANVEPGGQIYQETGQGMGGTLRVASEKQGYTLTDRATYLALQEETDLGVLVEGAESLLNIYHVMQVNPEKFNTVKVEPAQLFVDFLISEETQKVIGEFGVEEYGQPLFFPDAK